MSYILNGTTLKRPTSGDESNSTLMAQQRTLSGRVGRDYFGSNKRIWEYEYENCNATDFSAINAIYQTYLSTGNALAWQVTETNYTVAATTVHIDLQVRQFRTKGNDYLSSFSLVLTEA